MVSDLEEGVIVIAVTELRPVRNGSDSTLDYIMDESKTLLPENSGRMDPLVSAPDGEDPQQVDGETL